MFEPNQISGRTGSLMVNVLYVGREHRFKSQRNTYDVTVSKPDGKHLMKLTLGIPVPRTAALVSNDVLHEAMLNAYAYAGHLDEYGDVDPNTQDEDDKRAKAEYDLFAPNTDGNFSIAETIWNLARVQYLDDDGYGEPLFLFEDILTTCNEEYKVIE